MKAILEFQLPEESSDFIMAKNSWKYKVIIDDMDNYLRNKLKYEEMSEEARQTFQQCRDFLSGLVKEKLYDEEI